MAAAREVKAAVDTISPAVAVMGSEWPMLEALMGGTAAMRLGGEKFLPRWPSEAPDSWNSRKDTATLFPAFRRTVSVMAGKPFSKPVTLSDDTPEQIAGWSKDIDQAGVNLHSFSAEMMAEALAYGFCGILVEAPKALETGRPVATVADQKAAGVRPYWVRVPHGHIVGYRVETINGVTRLSQLRIKEPATTADGEFGERDIERIRVLTPGAWAVYEKRDAKLATDEPWVQVDAGVSGLPYIPFVPLYGARTGFMQGVSPLRDLAYLNVKHWQSQSDQDTILHVARVPILAISGGDEKTVLTVGAASAVMLPMGAKLEFVEHTGAAIDAGAKSLTDLEQQMIQAGAELLVKKEGQRTATESANDAEANKSDLQRIVEGFEDALDSALRMMADYASLPAAGNVSLYKDFGAATLSDASAQLVLLMEQGGVITTQTAIKEFQRRGSLSADIDPDKEAAAARAQPPKDGVGAEGRAKPLKTPSEAPELDDPAPVA